MEYDLEKISAKIQKKKFVNKIIKRIISIVLIFVFFINSILLYYNLKGEKNPKILGMYFFNIVSRKHETNFV